MQYLDNMREVATRGGATNYCIYGEAIGICLPTMRPDSVLQSEWERLLSALGELAESDESSGAIVEWITSVHPSLLHGLNSRRFPLLVQGIREAIQGGGYGVDSEDG